MEERLARFRAARRAEERRAEPGLQASAGEPGRSPPSLREAARAAFSPRARPAPSPQEAAGRPGPALGGVGRALLSHVAWLKFLLWLVLLGLAAELHFGLPCFLLSLFYWLYAGMRGPAQRRPGELSAYSVFNPGCRAIQGALTAEQLERELRYAPGR